MALPRHYRLRSSSLINLTYQKGASCKTPFFRMQYKKKNGDTQIAIVVSKKIDSRAVVRNQLKRKISGALAQMPESWKQISGMIVISVFEASKNATPKEIIQALQQTLQKIQKNIIAA